MNFKIFLCVPALLLAAACNSDNTTIVAASKTPASKSAAMPNGKLSAPINIDYSVLGTAIVGQPVAIELRLTSPLQDRPISLNYFVNDADTLMLGESQPAEIILSIPGERGTAARQVTVVPQREGRLYLNVTAEIETDNGIMLKSMSIPIAVGPAGNDAAVNGELRSAADGDTVVSMPAREN